MHAEQQRSRARHRGNVQRPLADSPAVARLERRRKTFADAVAVAFSFDGKTRVKSVFRLRRAQHDDSRGQARMQRAQQRFRRIIPARIEMKALPARVNAGIRAPAPVDADFLARDLRQPFFEKILHRQPACLALPAVKVRAVVGDDAAVARESVRNRVERFFARRLLHEPKKKTFPPAARNPDFPL